MGVSPSRESVLRPGISRWSDSHLSAMMGPHAGDILPLEMKGRRILVTGGAGFLGSHFVRDALASGAERVVNFDLLTYAGDRRRLAGLEDDPRYVFVRGDVASASDVGAAMREHAPDVVVHYGADTHVTRSESDPERFFSTNVEGTRTMLDASITAGVTKFVHISTDEVYGPTLEGAFHENDKPVGIGGATSPYAQSKTLGDDLVLSYAGRLAAVVARPTNAFGPWQFPEKAFPRWIVRALSGDSLPVWGDGLYIRQWLFAEDFARAIEILAERGTPGEAYNVGPTHDPEITNIDLVRWLLRYLDLDDDRIKMTAYDRPDHDRRYAVDSSKIAALGWASGDVWKQFGKTVDWYRANGEWWKSHVAEAESIYSDSKSA